MPIIARISDEHRNSRGNLELTATVTSLSEEFIYLSQATRKAKFRALLADGIVSKANLEEGMRDRVIINDVETTGERVVAEEFIFDITVIS